MRSSISSASASQRIRYPLGQSGAFDPVSIVGGAERGDGPSESRLSQSTSMSRRAEAVELVLAVDAFTYLASK